MVPPGAHGGRTAEHGTAADPESRTRRQILRGSLVTAGAIGIGLGTAGTVAAKGKGGESAVPVSDYEDRTFEFDGNGPVGFDTLTCAKGGQGITLAEWEFHYVGDDPGTGTIYTRDNAIDTSRRYQFAGKGQVDCGDFYLTPFRPADD